MLVINSIHPEYNVAALTLIIVITIRCHGGHTHKLHVSNNLFCGNINQPYRHDYTKEKYLNF